MLGIVRTARSRPLTFIVMAILTLGAIAAIRIPAGHRIVKIFFQRSADSVIDTPPDALQTGDRVASAGSKQREMENSVA